MKINDVLRGKGNQVVTISPEATVTELLALLAEHNVGALVVSPDGTSVAGIVSERDVVRLLNSTPDAGEVRVSAIMTSQVHTCGPDDLIDNLMRLMTEQRIRHVPVVVDGALTGIVSIGDVVKSRIGELEFEREQLSNYIAG
ncbi:putative signal transduction protein with CBS domains [Kribbella flavida DSM 17836]|uniref:Putative signal transduction protein with CBS domains n=1 Tax=Kribbella flavida (strain DSM 17836 / JCM 10339 / NBRC 14399) TaxID=479435 RepID=D2Q4Z1_KRIFD|nr:CBS domain-containing protein [Kribbella flavida]ADB34246.1 putative signal transduction protein with CBS domains [Kribbella flavida DSM 17836]